MNQLNNLYEQITPKTTPQELSEKIINATEIKRAPKRTRFRPAAALAAAGITVSSLVLTAGAVNGWDYSTVFQSIFGEKAVNIEGNIVPEATILKDETENFDIRLAAVAADKHGIIAIVDITDKNGDFIIDENSEAYSIFSDIWFSLDLIDELEAYGSSTSARIISAEGNTARVNIHCDVGDTDLAGRRFNIMVRTDNASEYDWIARCKIENTGNEIVYEKDISLEAYDVNNNLRTIDITEIAVSPIALYIDGSGTGDFFAALNNLDSCYALTESGEEIRFCNMGASSRTDNYAEYKEIMHFVFEEPMNPDEITAVVLGENVIEIK